MLRRLFSGKESPDDTLTSDDILGKEVIDPEGGFLGVVEKIHIDAKTVDITSFSVDKGFLKKGLLIGKGYVERITPHAVFLRIRPVLNMRGMKVFDYEGRKVGTVKQVVLRGRKNRLKHLIIVSGVMRKERIIPPELIKFVGENIFLNQKKEAVLKQGMGS